MKYGDKVEVISWGSHYGVYDEFVMKNIPFLYPKWRHGPYYDCQRLYGKTKGTIVFVSTNNNGRQICLTEDEKGELFLIGADGLNLIEEATNADF